MTIYKHVFKQQQLDTVSPGHFLCQPQCIYILFSTKDRKQVSMIRKFHNHTLQTKTSPDIIIHFIKQRDQFHFERKSFVPNVVVQHVNCFVVCCAEMTHYKRKVPSYLMVMWHTMLVSV